VWTDENEQSVKNVCYALSWKRGEGKRRGEEERRAQIRVK
jgi:hypothetical protein